VPTKHKLGFGHGRIIEYEDGSVGYIHTDSLVSQSFRVRIADITGFATTKGHKMLRRNFQILGNGTLLASVEVNHGTAEKLEAWFRSHPQFSSGGAPAAPPAPASSGSVADEIAKLGELRKQGLLSDEEFAAQKARLLS
jgi:hypothetical protein